MGASGDLHSQNSGRQLATGSSLEAPAPGKGCTPLSAGDNTPCCAAGNIKMGAVAGRCPNKHQLGAPAAAPALLSGWGKGTIQHHSGRAGHCPFCATNSSDGPICPGLALSRTQPHSGSQHGGPGRSTAGVHICVPRAPSKLPGRFSWEIFGLGLHFAF